MGWRKMSNDEFHEAAVKGLRAMHKRGEVSDDDMADQERWWARGGHLDGEDGETTTWIGSCPPPVIRKCIPVFVRVRVLLRRFLVSFGEDLRRGGRRR